MENIIYDNVDMDELYRLIDTAIVGLERKNTNYRELKKE